MLEEKRILIIDDEIRMADSLKTLLTNYGYKVAVAYNGEEGIECLKQNDYHLVITDLRMGEIDGLDIMKYVENNLPKTYMIIITGHASTESAIEALHRQAFDYITKPFDFDLLKSSVEKAFIKIESMLMKDEMIYMLTHDIKIPLTSIIGYASIIFDKNTGKLNERAKHYVETICVNSQKILSLIDNFLTSCKIEAGKLVLCGNDIDVNFLFKELLNIFVLEASKNGIKLEYDIPECLPTIYADENLIYRAFANILSNAIKYTPKNGLIKVKVEKVDAAESHLEKDTLLFNVSNTGGGIAQEDLPYIFDKYKRAKNIRGIEGSGLGLYVVKFIIEAHCGKVDVASIPNEVTTFSIYLPLKPDVAF